MNTSLFQIDSFKIERSFCHGTTKTQTITVCNFYFYPKHILGDFVVVRVKVHLDFILIYSINLI